jgi:hypothetical protein
MKGEKTMVFKIFMIFWAVSFVISLVVDLVVVKEMRDEFHIRFDYEETITFSSKTLTIILLVILCIVPFLNLLLSYFVLFKMDKNKMVEKIANDMNAKRANLSVENQNLKNETEDN